MKQEQFQQAWDIKDSIQNEDIFINRLNNLIENAENAGAKDDRLKFLSLFDSNGHYIINQEPGLALAIYESAKALILDCIKGHQEEKKKLETEFDDL